MKIPTLCCLLLVDCLAALPAEAQSAVTNHVSAPTDNGYATILVTNL